MDTPIEELLYRFNSIIPKYIELAKDLAEKLEQFGKYKNELQALVVEFDKRGFDPQVPESLLSLLEKEIKQREPEVGQNTDKT